jgi:predicted transcriptional regulator
VIAGRNHTEEVRMSPSDKTGDVRGHKTLALRLDDELHARLSIVARLRDTSLTEEIRRAIDAHLEQISSSPEFTAKAEEVLAEIERDAANRRAAITSMLGADSSSKATAGRKPRGGDTPPAA